MNDESYTLVSDLLYSIPLELIEGDISSGKAILFGGSIHSEPIVKGTLSYIQSLIPTILYRMDSLYLLTINSLVLLPLYDTLHTIITSMDVIHCWSIYSLGSKIDGIPGRLNLCYLVRLFSRGLNRGFCFELCGQGHYSMQTLTLFL